MSAEFYQGDKKLTSLGEGYDLWEIQSKAQRDLVVQLAINFEHLEDITGRTAEDFINTLKNDEQTIKEILSLEIGGKEYSPPYEMADLEQDVRKIRNQNMILQMWIDQQVEFTLANIPEGKTLSDDQQSALYLMTSSTGIKDETDEFLLKSQRARIGNHMSLPEMYREEAEAEIQKFHEYVFSNPEIRNTYLIANREGNQMSAQERLDFANFHIGIRAKFDGREAPKVMNHTFEGEDSEDIGRAEYTNNKILMQEKDGWYYRSEWPEFLRVLNHEYDHFRERDKAANARTQTTSKESMELEKIDRHNAGLVLQYNANTYFSSREAPEIKGHTGYELYRNQPKERYAEGIGQMWKQAVMDIPKLHNAIKNPQTITSALMEHHLAVESAVVQENNFSEGAQRDIQKFMKAIKNIDATSPASVLWSIEKAQERAKKLNQHAEEIAQSPFGAEINGHIERLDKAAKFSERAVLVEKAMAGEPQQAPEPEAL